MTRRRALLLTFICWTAVLALPVSTVDYAVMVNRAYAEAARRGLSGLWCGNTVTDPLALILSFGTPAATIAVVALGALRLRQLVNTGSVVAAAVVTVGCTGGLSAYGTSFFKGWLPGHYLSELVWWMRPIGSWFSV